MLTAVDLFMRIITIYLKKSKIRSKYFSNLIYYYIHIQNNKITA